jgi:hypothetical protein
VPALIDYLLALLLVALVATAFAPALQHAMHIVIR